MDKKTWLALAAVAVGGYFLYRYSKKKDQQQPAQDQAASDADKVRDPATMGGVATDIGGGQTVMTGGVRPIATIVNSSTTGTGFDNQEQATAFSPISSQISTPDIGFGTDPRVLNPMGSTSGTRLSVPAEALFVGYSVPQFGMQRIDANF